MEDFDVLGVMAEIPPYDNLVYIKFTDTDSCSAPKVKGYELDKDIYSSFVHTNNKVILNLKNKRGSDIFVNWLMDPLERKRSTSFVMTIEMMFANYHGNTLKISCEFKGIESYFDLYNLQLTLHSRKGVVMEYSKDEEDYEYITEEIL